MPYGVGFQKCNIKNVSAGSKYEEFVVRYCYGSAGMREARSTIAHEFSSMQLPEEQVAFIQFHSNEASMHYFDNAQSDFPRASFRFFLTRILSWPKLELRCDL
jgi:hypothetical protein